MLFLKFESSVWTSETAKWFQFHCNGLPVQSVPDLHICVLWYMNAECWYILVSEEFWFPFEVLLVWVGSVWKEKKPDTFAKMQSMNSLAII